MTSAGGRNGSAERRARGALALCRDVAPLGARQLRGAVATGVVGAASGVGLLTTSAWLITRASLRPAVLALGVAIGAVQGFALARGVARYGERLALHDVSLDVLSRLRLRLFDRLATLVPGGLGRRRAGEVLTAFVSDADDVAESLARVVTAGVDASAGAALAVAVAAVVEPLAGAALAVGATATALVSARLARMSRSAAGREAAARADVADAVVAAVRSAPELVAHGRSDLVRREVAAAERRGGRASARSALLAGARRAAVLVLGTATVAAVLVAGLTARDAHRIGGVSLAVLAFASLAALEPFAALADALGSAVAGDVAARRIGALDLLAPPAPEPPAP
ncbi:MAG: ABC transporter transmembrane domain-containing protein, partial [Actinomycetota bacterium]|nr:ABC transporter transmembrane domain-containing protein [Actinomycetota bacterium]